MLQHSPTPKTNAGQVAGEIDDVMIKDPVCDVYFPKKDAVYLKADGQDMFFCSTACRDKFVDRRSKK
ncbi:MAG: hypothetical protein ABIK98_13465 [Pseudomonadota bacterium]|uniref:YHS domain-containing protein n=1 Tax=Candidatus Desulfatibia profunda TaxID=2841695 RepID=A0A8J6NTN0_9BACT|nr:hypothetical protein [Candidatus Desulfatibia profunda]